ncbi:MAG: 2,3-bisphosphoglycerate-independent phosphoglycerate mutase [Ignavibacteriales bacterium]|nr:2,3-bisphosphoglycerate-independent phosphoglycerate mutase [Ignavibacteriales bacterium]
MKLELKKLEKFQGRKGPLLLIIMDGVGIGKHDESDAVFLADTPNLDKLFQSKLKTQLKAHGTAVGLPSDDDMGNSEVGHNAFGAGKVFAQGAKLVNNSIANGSIFKTDNWNTIIQRGLKGNTIHFIGLLSDGNVHSHIEQLLSLIKNCAENKIEKVRLHILLDGRDVGEKTALKYIEQTEQFLHTINSKNNFDYKIASGGGRMVTTMDRYNADWNVVKKGWNAHVLGKARKFKTATEAIQTYYSEDEKITDQYLPSFVIADDNDEPIGKIKDGDSVIFFNFRGDRAIEISKAFEERDLREFDREFFPDVFYAGLMQYDGDLNIPKNYLVQPPAIDNTVSEYLCSAGIKSFAISETQKFGHVTYFWNGNRSGYIDEKLEKYFEIPSDRIEFDKAPKMKAIEITEKTIELLSSNEFRWGRVNFPNGDMVGHTGIMEAAIIAVETVDDCVGKLLQEVAKLNGIAIVTADHGNADEMFEVKNGKKIVKTAHSLNPVPFIIFDPNYNNEYKMAIVTNPGLTNVANTLINLLGYECVKDYDKSLIEFL